MMAKVGEKLNLKEHWAGLAGNQVKIFGPTGSMRSNVS